MLSKYFLLFLFSAYVAPAISFTSNSDILELAEYENPSKQTDGYIEMPICMEMTLDNHLYLLDAGFFVYHWDEHQRFVGRFGGKGEGPGFFVEPKRLTVYNQEVWVVGRDGRTSIFSLSGEFKKLLHISSPFFLRDAKLLPTSTILTAAYNLFYDPPGQNSNLGSRIEFGLYSQQGELIKLLKKLDTKHLVKGPRGLPQNKAFGPEADIQRGQSGAIYFGFSENTTIYKTEIDGHNLLELKFELPTGPLNEKEKALFQAIRPLGKKRFGDYNGFNYDHEKAFYTHFLVRNGKIAFILTPKGSLDPAYGMGFSQGTYQIHDLATKKKITTGKYVFPEDTILFFEDGRTLACIASEDSDYRIVEVQLRGME